MSSTPFPKLMLITDRKRMLPGFDLALLAALQAGAKWIQFREKDLTPRQAIELFAKAQRLTEKFGAQLFWNGRADVARWCHADGLHLPEHDLPVEAARASLGFHTPVGVSVHSLEAARRAAGEGANYILCGMVFPSESHPGELGAGLEVLASVAAAVKIPVYAVGGMNVANAQSCLDAGAAGIATIGAAWSAENVAKSVGELIKAVGDPPPLTAAALHASPSPLAGLIGKS